MAAEAMPGWVLTDGPREWHTLWRAGGQSVWIYCSSTGYRPVTP